MGPTTAKDRTARGPWTDSPPETGRWTERPAFSDLGTALPDRRVPADTRSLNPLKVSPVTSVATGSPHALDGPSGRW